MLLRFFYSLLLFVAAPFLLIGLYKKKPGKPSVGKRWKEHFGKTPALTFPKEITANTSLSAPVWLHSVSVGETISITPLVKKLRQQYPNTPIVLTTTTPTGAKQAEKLTRDPLVVHRYMPLDFKFAVRGFIKKIKPQQLLIMETELWPNTIHHVAKAGIPIRVINARLSERSKQKYQKILPIFHWLTEGLTQVLCQYQADADRFIELGLDESKVATTGSLKFEIEIDASLKAQGNILRQDLGCSRPVWIAASTHEGEDELLLRAHQKLLRHDPDALLILVPRHPERFDDVYGKILSHNLSATRRTQPAKYKVDSEDYDPKAPQIATQVYLADTMGEMPLLIQAADICFMGGSLIGDKVGGHNLLEPAALAKPLLTGPSYYNFVDITKMLKAANAVQIVEEPIEIAEALIALFHDKQEMKRAGDAALKVVEENQGAIERTLEIITVE